MQRLVIGPLALGILLLLPLEALAQDKCVALKYKATSSYAVKRAKCFSVAAKNGTAVSPECLIKAEDKFGLKFAKIGTKFTDCDMVGEAPAIRVVIDSAIAGVEAQLEPAPTCCNMGDIPGFESCGFRTLSFCNLTGQVPAPGSDRCDASTGTCQQQSTPGLCCEYTDPLTGEARCNAGPWLDSLLGCSSVGGTLLQGTCQPDQRCQ